MVNWQITATTIYCDAVDDEVTLMVYSDGTTRCTGYARYGEPSAEIAAELKKKAVRLKRDLGCQGLECSRIMHYRDGLLAEEREGQ